MATLVDELKRRSVFRIGFAYLVVAWLVLQVTDLVFENLNAPDWVMQAIMLVLVAGLPIALVFAWAFELNDSGLQRDTENTPKSVSNSRIFYAFVGVFTIVAIGLFLWPKTGSQESATVTANDESLLAIAVLPFESFSEDRQDQYFADGLADTLLHKLAQLQTLTVIARNSSFQYKGQNVDVREVGENLGVPTILEGSVQRQGNDIRVIAQLVSTEDGSHWWSGTFDGTFDNIFDLQDEIAGAIAAELQITLSDRDSERLYRNGTTVPAAYDALARARSVQTDYDGASFNPDDNAKLRFIQNAIELDPHYARAWVEAAAYYNELAFLDVDNSRSDEFVAESMAAARKAIEVDPDESDAYAVLGIGHWRGREVVEAEEAYRKALAINPNNNGAIGGLGLVLTLSNPDEAYRLFKRTLEIDPNNDIVYRQLALALLLSGRLEETVEQLRVGIEKAPDFFLFYEDLARLYSRSFGQYDNAAKVGSDLLRRDPDSRVGMNTLASAWFAVADTRRAKAWNDKLLEENPNDNRARELRIALLQQQGDIQSALVVADTLATQGFAGFGRNLRFLELCLAESDRACAVDHLENLIQFLVAFEGRSGRSMPGIETLFDYFRGRLQYPDAMAAREALEKAGNTFAGFSLLSAGGFDVDDRRYYLAEILVLQGQKQAAVAELHRTLELADGGFVSRAPGAVAPENSQILTDLRGEPGYDDWLVQFTARRSAMRAKMIEMEAAGEIILAP